MAKRTRTARPVEHSRVAHTKQKPKPRMVSKAHKLEQVTVHDVEFEDVVRALEQFGRERGSARRGKAVASCSVVRVLLDALREMSPAYFRPSKRTMSLVTVTRAMARRLPSRDHAKDSIGRRSVKRVS
jgi:hypothetical protein